MAEGISKIEGWCKFLQTVLILISGVLILGPVVDLHVLLSEPDRIYIYVIDSVTLVLVLAQLIGIFTKKLTPRWLVILLAIKVAIIWTVAAAIEFLSFYYCQKVKEIPIGNGIITLQITDTQKYSLLILAIVTAVNAFLFLVEALAVSYWRKSAAAAQRGFVINPVNYSSIS